MDNIEQNIMRIIGVNKVKYDILDIELKKRYVDSEMINIHIDLNSILKPLFDDTINSNINGIDAQFHISSSILNIIAHYRAYFVYRHKLPTRFFLHYYTSELNTGCRYFKKFRSFEHQDVLVNIINGLKLVKIISKYCNRVYFIEQNDFDPIVNINYYIDKFTNDVTSNLVLTKDEMLFQLINCKNTDVLRMKRDESIVISKDTIFEYILRRNKYEPKFIGSDLLSLYMAYSGVPTRELKGVGKTKIIKTIDNLIEKGTILNEYHPKIEYILGDLALDTEQYQTVLTNYYKLDLSNLYKKLTRGAKMQLDDCIQDKFSKRDLKDLNVKYYTGELALMLEELTLEPNKQSKVEWW